MVVEEHGLLFLVHPAQHFAVSAGLAVRQQGSPDELSKMCELIKSAGIGVFQEYYQNELLSSYSSSTISWIPSLQIFFMLAMVCQIQ
jgi:hypothetical protein